MYCHQSQSQGPSAECAAALVHNDVLPFYREHGLTVSAILTDNGREFCGTENHPFELYLALNDIEHRRTKMKSSQTNGFIERFNKTVLDEFFRIAFRENFYQSVDALQADLDRWLYHYNSAHTGAIATVENDHSIPYCSLLQLLDMTVSCTVYCSESIIYCCFFINLGSLANRSSLP